MRVHVAMDETEIRTAIAEYIFREYGIMMKPGELEIQVKSKQNYKAEWERAAIRVDVDCIAVTK